jgi:hypothetical protein
LKSIHDRQRLGVAIVGKFKIKSQDATRPKRRNAGKEMHFTIHICGDYNYHNKFIGTVIIIDLHHDLGTCNPLMVPLAGLI